MSRALHLRPLGKSGLQVSALGLGTSHIASLSTRVNAKEIDHLLDQAWAGGIRFFDTADIYGQGDSERRLSRLAGRDGAVICTKAGLRLKASQPLIRALKPVLRPVLTRVKRVQNAAAQARQASETHDLNPTRLTTRLEGSLRRLKREAVDVFLLHSPPRAALTDQRLFEMLHHLKRRGLAQGVGVSCQSIEDALWVITETEVDVLQIPLQAQTLPAATQLLDQAAEKRIGVIAREVLGGVAAHVALPPLLQDPRIGVTLTGTTNSTHLAENLSIAAGA